MERNLLCKAFSTDLDPRCSNDGYSSLISVYHVTRRNPPECTGHVEFVAGPSNWGANRVAPSGRLHLQRRLDVLQSPLLDFLTWPLLR